MDQRDRLLKANATLDESTQKLQDCLTLLNETNEVGASILSDLDKQGEQIKHVKNKLNNVDTNIDKSNKILNNMNRSIFNPRYWFN